MNQLSMRPDRGARSAWGLTADEMQRFHDDGYLVLGDFCAKDELQSMRASLGGLFAKQVGRREGQQFDMLGLDEGAAMTQPQIVSPSTFMPALLQTAHFRKVATIARQLLGADANFSFDHSILKPAGSLTATPWHQDEAHHRHTFFRYSQISFWMPLQDTPLVSGCMRYIPGSHLGPVLPHRKPYDDPRIHAIECAPGSFDESKAVAEPVRAGTCILHDGRTLHGALPNTSDIDRIAYVIAFVGPPQRISATPTTAREHFVMATKLAQTPANVRRRQRWLLQGGFVTALWRRMRQGFRSNPKLLLLKLRLLMTMGLSRKDSTKL